MVINEKWVIMFQSNQVSNLLKYILAINYVLDKLNRMPMRLWIESASKIPESRYSRIIKRMQSPQFFSWSFKLRMDGDSSTEKIPLSDGIA